jgi:hypothetical protein
MGCLRSLIDDLLKETRHRIEFAGRVIVNNRPDLVCTRPGLFACGQ